MCERKGSCCGGSQGAQEPGSFPCPSPCSGRLTATSPGKQASTASPKVSTQRAEPCGMMFPDTQQARKGHLMVSEEGPGGRHPVQLAFVGGHRRSSAASRQSVERRPCFQGTCDSFLFTTGSILPRSGQTLPVHFHSAF